MKQETTPNIELHTTQVNEILGNPTPKKLKYGNYLLCAFITLLVLFLIFFKYPISITEPVLVRYNQTEINDNQKKGQLEGIISMGNEYAKKIKNGLLVNIKLELSSINIEGYVENINYDPKDQRYELKIRINTTSNFDNLSIFLHDGLQGEAQIIIKHESILSILK